MGSEVASIVTELGCGLVADPDDPDDVVRAISWARAHPEALAEMGRRAAAGAGQFERGRTMARLVHLTEAAVAQARSRPLIAGASAEGRRLVDVRKVNDWNASARGRAM